MQKLLFLIGILLTIAVKAENTNDTIVVENTKFWDGVASMANWNRPLWADMHSTLFRAEVSWAVNSSEYDWGEKGDTYRPYVFSNLGVDLPVWSGNFSNGKYGFNVSMPFMIDIWLDMFERITAPVINTGYRFGAFDFGFIHRLDNPWHGIKNYAIKLSPMKHECTHLGDELTIKRLNDSLEITRVNVSYNYAELVLTINDPDGSLKKNHCFRFGFMLLHNFKGGWYNILPEEGDVEIVTPTDHPYEFYLQYQYQTNTRKNFQGIASFELRNRPRYNYPFHYTKDDSDWFKDYYPNDEDFWGKSTWTINGFLGVRFNNPKSKAYFSKIGAGLRGYMGINPYGQFRSVPMYNQWGFALIFE